MVLLVLYNSEYDRQFEMVISRNRWYAAVEKYGFEGAVRYLFTRKRVAGTSKKSRAFHDFVHWIFDSGDYYIERWRSRKSRKRARLERRGRGEYIVRRGPYYRGRRLTKHDLPKMDLRRRR